MSSKDMTTTPFGAHSTADDVVAGTDLRGKRAVITGGASGIGRETARALVSAGAEVTLAVRDLRAGEEAAGAIIAATGNPAVQAAKLDLADRATISAFTRTWTGPLDILVNNAGVMAIPDLDRTAEGWEQQFATNHLGHAELALGLHDALATAGSARVVQVASSAHLMGAVDFGDIHFEHRPYEAWSAYAQSKTAMILFTVALAKHWAGDGISANALHPGGIMTNLQRHLDDAQLAYVGAKDAHGTTLAVPPGWKTIEQGAATTVLLAASPHLKGITGRYFEDGNEAAVQPEPAPGKTGVAGYAIDPELAERLFVVTREHLSH
ncbi:SDR family NAD(P)-dependent oxidoreductase [Streptomyces sp. NPDC051217]|uniref:SDR family NAD(P)-dependent oxidoreductase n=1 Tax=Streptomyces sp. NPDC051217 TaxID=3365644 RepID=UPI0037B6313D